MFLYGAGGTSDALLLKAVRAAGYKGKVVGDLSYATSTIPQAAGSAADTVVAFSPIDFGNPTGEHQEVHRLLQGRLQRDPDAPSPPTVSREPRLRPPVSRRPGKPDGNAIATAIQGLNYPSVVGTLAYTKDYHGGPETAGTYKPVSFKNGEYAGGLLTVDFGQPRVLAAARRRRRGSAEPQPPGFRDHAGSHLRAGGARVSTSSTR